MDTKKEREIFACKFGERISELRKLRWQQYKENQHKGDNDFDKFSCCRTQETLAEALNLERRTIGKWELGTTIPTIDMVDKLCNKLECNVDYLLGHNDLVGLSPCVIASHYSKISIDIVNKAIVDPNYRDFLNHFMHPNNCHILVDSVTNTAWKDFINHKGLDELQDPIKALVIKVFQSYQVYTPATEYSKESFKNYFISMLPENKFSFTSHKLDEQICVISCLSNTKVKELGLSKNNPKNYQIFIDFIVDYCYDILYAKEIIDIQKTALSRLFIDLFEKYLSE